MVRPVLKDKRTVQKTVPSPAQCVQPATFLLIVGLIPPWGALSCFAHIRVTVTSARGCDGRRRCKLEGSSSPSSFEGLGGGEGGATRRSFLSALRPRRWGYRVGCPGHGSDGISDAISELGADGVGARRGVRAVAHPHPEKSQPLVHPHPERVRVPPPPKK